MSQTSIKSAMKTAITQGVQDRLERAQQRSLRGMLRGSMQTRTSVNAARWGVAIGKARASVKQGAYKVEPGQVSDDVLTCPSHGRVAPSR